MSLPLSCSPYDDLLDTCAPVLRPVLLVDSSAHGYARIGLAAPAPLIDASRPHGEAPVLTVRSVLAPLRDWPLAGTRRP